MFQALIYMQGIKEKTTQIKKKIKWLWWGGGLDVV